MENQHQIILNAIDAQLEKQLQDLTELRRLVEFVMQSMEEPAPIVLPHEKDFNFRPRHKVQIHADEEQPSA